MPWKYCPDCGEISYSAATHYDTWSCPHCGRELRDEPEYDRKEAQALRTKRIDNRAQKQDGEDEQE